MNKVETFNKFNGGMRRPNRTRHLELCGFKLTRVVEPYLHENNPRPKEMAMNHVNDLSKRDNCPYHGVTLPKRNYEGWTYYEVWTKPL